MENKSPIATETMENTGQCNRKFCMLRESNFWLRIVYAAEMYVLNKYKLNLFSNQLTWSTCNIC